jgi:hypothetical protein
VAKFLIKLCVFVFVVSAVLLWVEVQLRTVPNSYNVKKKILENAIPTAQVLITGTSREYFGIKPSLLGCKGINMANVSQSLYYDYHIGSQYLPRLKDLKVLIIGISEFSLEYEISDDDNEPWRKYFYDIVFDIPPEDGRNLDIRRFSLIALYSPSIVQRYARDCFKVDLTESIDAEGASTVNFFGPSTSIDENDKNVADWHVKRMKRDRVSRNAQFLCNLIEAAKKQHIAVVLITSPARKTYRDHFDAPSYEVMQKTIRSISQQYHVDYFNYYADNRFTAEDFSDCYHLYARGTEKYSRIIKAEIISKYVVGAPALSDKNSTFKRVDL